MTTGCLTHDDEKAGSTWCRSNEGPTQYSTVTFGFSHYSSSIVQVLLEDRKIEFTQIDGILSPNDVDDLTHPWHQKSLQAATYSRMRRDI